MKIERINENQIRCTLTSFDLSVRNLNLVELAYGTEKARKLFREMIQKASNEVGFEAEDIPLMVEAIPLSPESIMLVITKIEDTEELDTRFSKFTPASEEGGQSLLSQLAGQLLEGVSALSAQFEDGGEHFPGFAALGGGESPEKADDETVRIFRFDSLDRLCEGAAAVGQIYNGLNSLYKKPDTRQYYLVLKGTAEEKMEFSRACNILAEYGSRISNEKAGEAYFREHYELMIRDKALQDLQKIG